MYILDNGSQVSGTEGFKILLNRLTYPNRPSQRIQTFGRSPIMVSLIFNHMLRDLYDRYHMTLKSRHRQHVNYELFSQFIAAISLLVSCIGFVDGAVRPCANQYMISQAGGI